ncbi:hypothetical protein ONS95_009640 [Cadophora gregata]|uniref:uncharacterized protein n=1 Tax=Cadophora gregata TaxID=51156 RepID=UPI0026DCF925|nr:uncharacterized protein ONS95_009640 [Cadophora gregata]KAK0124696.1 hypothetical protein ONS95_009640 [Cadophora gregata]KAK0129444.1 hypothetical protein ONS96_000016 [Cadophora gregata f. sp. sojae]
MSAPQPQCGPLLLPDELPSADNITFPETSFFKKDGALLPTPAEVREAAGPQGGIRLPPVSFPTMNLIVKYGRYITKAEGQCLWAVRRLCPKIPVPEVYGWCQDGKETFIYMQLIEGATLEQEWPRMIVDEKYEVCVQLRGMLDELRQLRQDPSDRFIGTINRQSVQDVIFDFDHPCKVFSDVTSFHDWFSREVISQMDPSDPHAWRRGLCDNVPIVFTHADLHRSNIMMAWKNGKPRVTAILDWHQSGWYPACWEFYKTKFTAREREQWEIDFILEFMQSYTGYVPWDYFVLARGT